MWVGTSAAISPVNLPSQIRHWITSKCKASVCSGLCETSWDSNTWAVPGAHPPTWLRDLDTILDLPIEWPLGLMCPWRGHLDHLKASWQHHLDWAPGGLGQTEGRHKIPGYPMRASFFYAMESGTGYTVHKLEARSFWWWTDPPSAYWTPNMLPWTLEARETCVDRLVVVAQLICQDVLPG